MKSNDILWKAALEDLFDDFLRFFYTNAEELFDLDRGFEYLDKELEQLFPPDEDKFSTRFVDKLVKVFTRNGNEEWILVHIEVQGYVDTDFGKRMFQYYYRILDKYDKSITAFAIFTDNDFSFHPKNYKRDFLGTKLDYVFNTFKILDLDDAALEASNNPFALAVLSAKLSIANRGLKDQQLFDLAFGLAKRLLKKNISKQKIRKVMTFLRYYLRFENQEIVAKFEKEIAILTERNITMGIEKFLLDQAEKKGIEKGVEIGREENIKEVALKMKESGLETSLISNITGLSVEEIKKLK